MKCIGLIGLGDMGSGLARNLIDAGYQTIGNDINQSRLRDFVVLGGEAASTVAEVGSRAEAVFVMVMSSDQVQEVIFGEEGLASTMKRGSVIFITATISPKDVVAIGERLVGAGIDLIDSPVSGGFSGAQDGTLTLMTAAPKPLLERWRPVLMAISTNIEHVGTVVGQGQIVKACLQSMIGSVIAATCEATVMAAKAGIAGQVIYDVFSKSSGGSSVGNAALENIIDRNFTGTGSHINTMHKDLMIALGLANELEVPLFTAATAMQLFRAARSQYPDGDNWAIAQMMEKLVGEELHRAGMDS
tara:strand:+ start:81 stop:986 length:906 start_codon:yes stop_codon:yes gene_type:complete